MHYLYLTLAIFAEVIATSSLKAANEFSNPIPSMLVVVGYLCSFYFLMLSLRNIPLGVAYAIWCGAGIMIIALIGVLYYKQMLDLAAMIGIALIVAGVCTIQLFSHTSTVH
jgi:small multidrug resistance pump